MDSLVLLTLLPCDTMAELAQLVECLTAEQEVTASILWVRPILRVLKQLRNEGNTFALQMARPSRGLDDHVKWCSHLQYEVLI